MLKQSEGAGGTQKSSKTKEETSKDLGEKETVYHSLINPKLVLPPGTDGKIKRVFKELQQIKVSDAPTAVSILVRVITELSTNAYLKKKKDTSKDGKNLEQKLKQIRDQYIADRDLRELVTLLLTDKLVTMQLNKITHSGVFVATETNIKDLWANLETLFNFIVRGK